MHWIGKKGHGVSVYSAPDSYQISVGVGSLLRPKAGSGPPLRIPSTGFTGQNK